MTNSFASGSFSLMRPLTLSTYCKRLSLSMFTTASIHPPPETHLADSGEKGLVSEEKRTWRSDSFRAEAVARIMISSADKDSSTLVASRDANSSNTTCTSLAMDGDPISCEMEFSTSGISFKKGLMRKPASMSSAGTFPAKERTADQSVTSSSKPGVMVAKVHPSFSIVFNPMDWACLATGLSGLSFIARTKVGSLCLKSSKSKTVNGASGSTETRAGSPKAIPAIMGIIALCGPGLTALVISTAFCISLGKAMVLAYAMGFDFAPGTSI